MNKTTKIIALALLIACLSGSSIFAKTIIGRVGENKAPVEIESPKKEINKKEISKKEAKKEKFRKNASKAAINQNGSSTKKVTVVTSTRKSAPAKEPNKKSLERKTKKAVKKNAN